MEARKITVLESTRNRKTVIMSSATTYGELKADLRTADISYEGMEAMVSPGKLILADDNSVLPTNVPWKGSVTNDLVLMFTMPNKEIKSGVIPADRSACYSIIKETPSLKKAIVEKFCKNYTNVSTQELIDFITEKTEGTASCCNEDSLHKLVNKLVAIGILSRVEANEILNNPKEISSPKKELSSPYSDRDIEDMFK